MGGGSAQTVGYKYYLGMHMILTHGPIDHVNQVKVDDRVAWQGYATGGQISIDKEGLFGGEEREGGIVGSVDIEMGDSTQLQNDYLQSQLGTDIPAYRGVVGAVLRQVYLGLNPYIKKWSFRAQRIYATTSGETQWYESKAPIGYIGDNVAFYFTLDFSGSMHNNSVGGKTRLQIQKENVIAALEYIQGVTSEFSSGIDIMVVAWGTNPDIRSSITYRNVTSGNIDSIITWINNNTDSLYTYFPVAFIDAAAFFAGSPSNAEKIIIFTTDGEPNETGTKTPQEITDEAVAIIETLDPAIQVYAINFLLEDTTYTAQIDTTPSDGVPIVTEENPDELTNIIINAITSHMDMNPSHIIRECLTNIEWGMGYPEADMNDASFTSAADQLFSEAMGISLLWDKQMPIEDFIQEIARHINATLYVDRITGQFTLKLIRDDYDEGTLLELDPSNIAKLSDYNRQDPGEAINSVTVIFWDHKTGKNGTVTADDIALIQAYGTVINTTVQYPGFTNNTIAAKTAARDLKTFSSPLLNCTIEANREASNLNIGDVFKLVWPDYHTGYVIMRVQQIAFGGPGNNKVRINASEDIFALPDAVIIGTEEPGWEDVQVDPTPVPYQLAVELPYYGLVLAKTQLESDTLLADNNDLGYWMASAARAPSAINAQVWIDDTSGYVDSAILDFAPYGQLSADLTKFGTTLTLTDFDSLEEVILGTMAQIDDEIVRVDAVDTVTGDVTIGRGILDTIPVKHSLGAYLIFTDENIASDGTEYVATEVLDVKVLPSTSNGTLPLASATASIITMVSRAFSPYRPANFRAGGFIDPDPGWEPVYPVLLEWDQRNRLLETGGNFLDWEDGAVAHEATTQYSLQIDAYQEDQVTLIAAIATDIETDSDYSLTEATIAGQGGAPFIKVTITAQRDGYDSYQSPVLFFRSVLVAVEFNPPTDYVAYWTMDDVDITAPTIFDKTSNNHDATMFNTPTTGVTGQKAEAVSFIAASSQYALVSDHADLKPANVTVMGWIKLNTVSASNWIAGNFSSTGGPIKGHYLYVGSTGVATFAIAKGTGSVLSVDFEVVRSIARVDDNEWHHIVGIFDGTDLHIYVDGLLIDSVTFAETIVYAAEGYRLASRYVSGVEGSLLTGSLDDIKVFARAVTDYGVKNTYLSDTNTFKEVHDYIARWELETASTVVPPTDFIAEWTMDDIVGTVLNETNDNHDATLVGTPTEVSGFDGVALEFNGIDQYATVVSHTDINNNTPSIVAWVKTTQTTQGLIVSTWNNTLSILYGWYIAVSDGVLKCRIAKGTGIVDGVDALTLFSKALINDGNWHHVAMTYDGSDLHLYIDGSLDTSSPITSGLVSNVWPLGIARYDDPPGSYFEGSLDGIKLFNYGVTADQIAALARIAPDATWRGHQGRINGSPISGVADGKIGNAITFDGVDDYINLPNNTTLKPTGSFTACGWAKSREAAGNARILSIQLSSADGVDHNGTMGFYLGTTKCSIGNNTGFVDGVNREALDYLSNPQDEWHHYAFIFDATNDLIYYYIDGILIESKTWTGGIAYSVHVYPLIAAHLTDPINGTSEAEVGGYYNMDIDDIRLYGRALGALEIYRVHASRIIAPPEDFVAEWTMDDVVSTTLNETLDNHDATLVASPTFAAGWEGDAMTLNGIDQHATIVDHADLRPIEFTIVGWINTSGSLGAMVFQSYNSEASVEKGVRFSVSGGNVRLRVQSASATINDNETTGAPLEEGVWYHIACTYDGVSVSKIYIDGILISTLDVAVITEYNTTNFVRIGCYEAGVGPSALFDGQMDKLQVFNREATIEEIEAMAGVIVAS